MDELRKNDIYIDITTLSLHIHYILDNHGDMYNEAVNRLNSAELINVFNEMNVNNAGRVVAYLALVYQVREVTRLVVPTLKNIPRVEGSFIRRLCSGEGYATYFINLLP